MSLKKKRVRKSIALVLVGVIVVTPIMNNVSAMENNYINSHIEIQENIEYFKNVETYIKFTLIERNTEEMILFISFHKANYPINYRFKKS